MANAEFNHALNLLCHGVNPYENFPRHLYRVDLQGWNSKHEFLKWSIIDIKALIIVEIGVWKGGSTIELAEGLNEHMQRGVVIAVDTWLGSSEHRLTRDWWDHLSPEHGYPSIYRTFMANVLNSGLQGYVVPLAIDGANAAVCIERVGIRPNIIHLDAAHDYEAVKRDVETWWPLLADDGIFIFDDYDVRGINWPGVKRAVDEHLATVPHTRFQTLGMKARVTKLAAQAEIVQPVEPVLAEAVVDMGAESEATEGFLGRLKKAREAWL